MRTFKQVKRDLKLVLYHRIQFIRNLKQQLKFNSRNGNSNQFVYKVLEIEKQQVKILQIALRIIRNRGTKNIAPNKTSARALQLVNYYHSQ